MHDIVLVQYPSLVTSRSSVIAKRTVDLGLSLPPSMRICVVLSFSSLPLALIDAQRFVCYAGGDMITSMS